MGQTEQTARLQDAASRRAADRAFAGAARAVISRFVRDEGAATAIEYAIIAAGIAAAIIVTVGKLGVNVNAMWTAVKNALS
ncbi:MAG: Flp family type IVb pilin [Pseudolabrys sp.]|nr:Flp family type IVb pilin [Pseudolabrys sp.]